MEPPRPIHRLHERFPCDIPTEVWLAGRKAADGVLCDIGMGGALIRCAAALSSPEPYELRFVFDGARWAFAGRVARAAAGHDPKAAKTPLYGIKFALDHRQEERLKSLIDKLRRQGKSSAWSDRVEWYWGV